MMQAANFDQVGPVFQTLPAGNLTTREVEDGRENPHRVDLTKPMEARD